MEIAALVVEGAALLRLMAGRQEFADQPYNCS